MTSDVVLTSAMRNNLLSLQNTQSGIDNIQNKLATGLKVSSALDNPQNFFASENLKNRASDLTRMLDTMGQSIQTVKAADKGVSGITKLIDQAESIISSAEEAITSGQVEAAITGNVDLSGIEDLTALAGVSNTDFISITYHDDLTDLTSTATTSIAIATDQSIDELMTEIKDIGGGGIFDAELTSRGYLKITELQGTSFNMAFEEVTGGVDNTLESADLALANGLGFGEAVGMAEAGTADTEGQYEVTVLASTKLVSGTFYTGTAGTLASASTALNDVMTTDGGSTERFDDQTAGTATTLEFIVNGDTTIDVEIDGLTIQGLVDGINNHDSNTGLIEAAYNATTGSFTIEATSQTVSSVDVVLDEAEDAESVANFGFGLVNMTAGGAIDDRVGESFKFASAAATLSQYEDDYNTLMTQIDEMAADSGYRGTNLINGDDLTTYFDEDRESQLTIEGGTLTSAGLSLSAADFTTTTSISATRTEVLAAKATVRSFGSTLANGLSVIQTREDFTKEMVNTLTEGSDKLTVADQNEEGARLLALQTRQQLGVVSLSMASQAQQAVLRLF